MFRVLYTIILALGLLGGCAPKTAEKPYEYKAEVLNAKWMSGDFYAETSRFFLVGQQGSIAFSENGLNWSYGDTSVMDTLHDIAFNSEKNVMVAVGENGSVLRSTDGGISWQLAHLDVPEEAKFSETRLNKVIYSPAAEVWLAAGTQNAILQSADQGLNWKLVSYNTSENKIEILDLIVEQQTGDFLFAAQHGTIGRSADKGETWDITQQDMQNSGDYIPHIVGFHQIDNILIAAADDGRLLISHDGGLAWKLTKIPTGGYFSASAFDPRHKVIVLTTQMGELAISKDNGEKWQLVEFEVNNWPSDDIPFLSGVVYDDKTESLLVLGNSGVVARSIDGGESWAADVFKPFFNMSVTSLLHDPKNNTYVAAGLGGVIAVSQDLGSPSSPLENWKLVRPGVDQYIRFVYNVPSTDIFVAGGQLGGLWRSDDDGISWSMIDVAYPFPNQPPHLRDIVQDEDSGALISAGPAGSIIRSTDTGLSWTPVFQGRIHEGEAFTQILVDKKNKAYIACEVLYRRIYRSLNGGISWEKVAEIDSGERNLWHGAVSEKLGLIMVVGQRGGIGISRDGGTSWHMAETNNFSDLYGAFADEKSGVLLAVGQNGVILRSDDGDTWKSVDSGTASTLRRAIKDPKTGALLAFGQEGVILRSVDDGQQWKPVESPIHSGELRESLLEPGTNNLILVGRDGAILRTLDGGLSWQILPSHTLQHFRNAASNPETGTIIAVGDGLVRLSRN